MSVGMNHLEGQDDETLYPYIILSSVVHSGTL